MTELAWRTGDPGIVFLDRINRDNPNPQLGDIESTNPCGEQPLLPYESCNLGSLNLARMVRYTADDVEVDWERISEVITTAVHMLDCVIDMNVYPIQEIADMSRRTRRIGLGVMGWSDLLIQMGVRYDSVEALELASEVMRFIKEESYRASCELAESRGPFPEWENSAYNVGPASTPMRNSAPVTIAPTGTISIIAGASSGIEPLFALSYVRNVMDNTRLVEGNAFLEAVARHEGFYSPELMEHLASVGSLEELDVPGWVKDVFRVSHDIDPRWHVRMQAAFQEYTDNAVSKTINFSHDATVEDVAEAYRSAYTLGCKGITVYRDGSKAEQVLSTGNAVQESGEGSLADPDDPDAVKIIGLGSRVPRRRPRQIHGITERVRTGHGNMYVTVNMDSDGLPFEVFGAMGKAGGCDAALLEAVSRLVSLALRAGIEPSEVTRQLRGITCCPAWDNGVLVGSGPDAVALVLDNIASGGNARDGAPAGVQLSLAGGPTENGTNGYSSAPTYPAGFSQRCPECNGGVVNQEGCLTCYSCGWNKCE
jgi:ribonucleoside-diphosphate reductase alpha chain